MQTAASANTTEGEGERPRVSVLLPAYNAAGTLGDALGSVLNQTLSEVEVIVADDASRDATGELARRAAVADPRVRVLNMEKNGGAAAARNRALAAARGDWVALLDADDRFAPDRLDRLVALGERRQADIVADNLRLVSAEGRDKGRALAAEDKLFATPLTAATFVQRNHFLTPGFKLGYLKPLFRRDFVVRHGLRQNEDLRIAEDFHFLLDALMAGGRFAADRQAGYDYRLTPGSLSRGLSLLDLQRLSAANGAVRARAGADAALDRALERRQRSVDLHIQFARFVDAVKGRRARDAGAIFARHPDLTPFLAFYGLQSLRKRLPGGRHLV
ncbi:glycosyltransferase family 2 protein [Pelagibius marinus]|uniref:glycosyltransferase family 2 protein n=1 Tax=Pelagibius marinus TaxID=2762760 RepID=UPI0018723D4C|nr:glycosyltransferase family 2 protein [Pelagibius marinus]